MPKYHIQITYDTVHSIQSNKNVTVCLGNNKIMEPEASFSNSDSIPRCCCCSKRLFVNLIGYFHIFASCVVFGWVPLQLCFLHEEVYIDLCTPEEIAATQPDNFRCDAQKDALNVNYVLKVAGHYLANAVFTPVIVKYGPRACSLLGASMLFVGSICMAYQQLWAGR